MNFFKLRGRSGTGVQRLVHRLFYTPFGSMIVSVLFGMALALLFQRVCTGDKCVVPTSPPMKEIGSQVFRVNNDCYEYKHRVVKCA